MDRSNSAVCHPAVLDFRHRHISRAKPIRTIPPHKRGNTKHIPPKIPSKRAPGLTDRTPFSRGLFLSRNALLHRVQESVSISLPYLGSFASKESSAGTITKRAYDPLSTFISMSPSAINLPKCASITILSSSTLTTRA